MLTYNILDYFTLIVCNSTLINCIITFLYIIFIEVFPLWQDAGMWQDALRICQEYIPHKLQQLQDEYDREMTKNSTKYENSVIYYFSFVSMYLNIFITYVSKLSIDLNLYPHKGQLTKSTNLSAFDENQLGLNFKQVFPFNTTCW